MRTIHGIGAGVLLMLAFRAWSLPVVEPSTVGLEEQGPLRVRNPVPLDVLRAAFQGGEDSRLRFDLRDPIPLENGDTVDGTSLYGSICAGPWPFEAEETDFAYRRFLRCMEVADGRGALNLSTFFRQKYNSENWTDTGSLMLRLDLWIARDGADQVFVAADLPIRFRLLDGRVELLPTLTEGPLLCRVDSDAAGSCTIALECDPPAAATVEARWKESSLSVASAVTLLRHEIALAGLPTDQAVEYRVLLDGEAVTSWIPIELPSPELDQVRFMYCGDSREGVGGGDRAYMGVNLDALERITALGRREGARFFLMGGDLINGYTTSPADFDAQFYAWKQAVLGFWRNAPIFPALGNHESLLRVFKGDGIDWLGMDRWPYEEASAEAVFADAFCNPLNAPANSNPAFPTYEENVYSLRFGPVKAICFNNNWWYSNRPDRFGGCPEGYMLQDQLDWIEREIAAADADPLVRYIVYYAQEPVFPCGGHVKDAMWHNGNNTVQARELVDGQLASLGPGIVDVRNRFLTLVCASEKSAVVFGADEHAYYKVKIGPEVPIGDPRRDDPDGNGILGDHGAGISPLTDLPRSIWFVTSGGGGAPYYAHEDTPWNSWWNSRNPDNYFYSSQENLVLVDAGPQDISLRALNSFGEEIDRIDNLLE